MRLILIIALILLHGCFLSGGGVIKSLSQKEKQLVNDAIHELEAKYGIESIRNTDGFIGPIRIDSPNDLIARLKKLDVVKDRLYRGRIIIVVALSEDGYVLEARKVIGLQSEIDNLILENIRESRWLPMKKDGSAIKSITFVPVNL